jgi:protein-serine/threonine kinase
MLAGYLPFDDDPANPEGDNINLLYKYIVSTPLTFPEYVTPHARDLLKRILVPDPRKRADLFEVARHSWLADYSHVVGFITSSNTETQQSVYASELTRPIRMQFANMSDTFEQPPTLARSASVREPAKPHPNPSTHGGLTPKRDQINQQAEKPKTSRENKRRTVQVEYVAPQSQTVRGEVSPPIAQEATPKSRQGEQRPVEIPPTDGHQSSSRVAHSSGSATASRPRHEPQRSVSDYVAFGSSAPAVRPSTGGTLGGSRMPSRGNSYAQPAAATVANTNAEGRFSQPKGKNYSISAPFTQPDNAGMGEPSIGRPSTQRVQSSTMPPSVHATKGHKRSNTVTETLGRVTSMFSRQPSYSHDAKSSLTSQNSYADQPEGRKKTYPPTSMPAPMSNEAISRQSVESSRRPSFSFSRKSTNPDAATKSGRRFSLIPSSLSKTFSQRESMPAGGYERRGSNAQRPHAGSRSGMGFRSRESRSPSQSTVESNPAFYDGQHDSNSRIRAQPGPASAPPQQTQFDSPPFDDKFPNPRDPHPAQPQPQPQTQAHNRPYRHPNESESQASAASEHHGLTPTHSGRAPYPAGMSGGPGGDSPHRKGVLQKSRKFADAYEDSGANKGSSGSSKKVMDFFRQMGRRRAGK